MRTLCESWRLVLPCLLLILAAGLSGPVWGADYKVMSYIKPASNITDTTPVQLIVQIDSRITPQIRPPQLTELQNLKIIGGPNTNSSFSWRNGQARSSFQISYSLLAVKAGPAEIPGLELTIEGQTYRTEPIRFDVAGSPGGAPKIPTQETRGMQIEGEDSADVFLQAQLGQKDVWVGQATPLTVLLHTVPRISSPMWRQQPVFDSFWVESIDVNPDDEAYRQRIGQKIYTVYPVERKLLIPLSPGVIDLDPYVAQMQVRASGADLFDILSRRRSQTIVRKTDPIQINVRPLPEGAPPGFGGAVGKFKLNVALDRSETAVNDAVAMRVTVQGEGTLRSVEAPLLNPPTEVKVFAPKLTESGGINGGLARSTKTWEWIIVPLTAGEIHLPEITFPYFDPEIGDYAKVSAPGPTIVVRRTEGAEEGPVTGRHIERQNRDLAFIKPLRGQLSMGGSRIHHRAWFVATLVLPALLLPLVVGLGRRRSRLMQDQGLLRARKAGSRARRAMQSVQRQIEQLDAAGFHEEVARTLVAYVADRFDRSPTGLTYDVADELLSSRGVDPDLCRRYRASLEACDFARFVPSAGKTERRSELLAEATSIVEALEGAL